MIKTRKGNPDALGPFTVPVALARIPLQGVFWLRALSFGGKTLSKQAWDMPRKFVHYRFLYLNKISAGCVKKHLVGKLALNGLC
jgi:hypothetical protein